MFINHKEHKGHKERRRGVGRACKAHVRPEGPEGAWRASHATLWGNGSWKSSGVSRRPSRPMGPICPTTTRRTARMMEPPITENTEGTEKSARLFLNHKEHEGHKERRRGVGRACKAHVRPEGPEGAWRASHATLWGNGIWKSSGVSRRPSRPMGPIGPTTSRRTAKMMEPPIPPIGAD